MPSIDLGTVTINGATSTSTSAALTRAGLDVTGYDGDPSAPAGGSVTTLPGYTLPNLYTNEPPVALVEGGVSDQVLDGNLNLNGTDTHSDGLLGFAFAPITGTGTVYSYERWVQLRFEAPFNSVQGLRFWVPNSTAIANGWTVKWGATATVSTPVNTASLIATSILPGGDPGLENPNLLTGPLRGDGGVDEYSLWLVLQASVDTSLAGPQLIGYNPESNTPVPLKLQFAWVDT